MNQEQKKSRLIKLASEMVLCRGMPPEFVTDWDLPKTTPVTAKREILRATKEAHDKCREWSRRIMEIVNDAK
jgi:hypothetical protein